MNWPIKLVMNSSRPKISPQEFANSISHGVGVLFGIVGIPVLVFVSLERMDWPAVLGVCIYSFSFLVLYTTSTLYHSMVEPQMKRVARMLDHISIYFLIAGSYTPFILFFGMEGRGIFLLSFLWILAFLGIFFKIFLIGKFRHLSTVIYLAMGWSVVTLPATFFESLPSYTWQLIVAGGLSYTIGVLFFLWEKWVWHHLVWHLLVLVGSICHFIAVLFAMLGW